MQTQTRGAIVSGNSGNSGCDSGLDSTCQRVSGIRGFTLIELMIAVAIVALLAAVAYPSYTKQIVRGQRTSGQDFVMDLAQREEQYFNDNRAYATTLAQLGYASVPPNVSPYYNPPAFNNFAGPPPGWTVSVSPAAGSRAQQTNDGTLVANSLGQRFRSVQANPGAGALWQQVATDCTFENGSCIPQ
jgi:type IV pilus assembly protein PilE